MCFWQVRNVTANFTASQIFPAPSLAPQSWDLPVWFPHLSSSPSLVILILVIPPGVNPTPFWALPSLISLFFLKGTTRLSAVPPRTAPPTQPQQPHDGTPWPGKMQTLSLKHPLTLPFPLNPCPHTSSSFSFHSPLAHFLLLLLQPPSPPLALVLFSLTPRRCRPPPVATSFYESRASRGSRAHSSPRPSVSRPRVGWIIHHLPHPLKQLVGGCSLICSSTPHTHRGTLPTALLTCSRTL